MEKWVEIAKRADFYQISEQFSIDPVIARIIRNRDVIGTENIKLYLQGQVMDLPDPGLMKDLNKAVEIIIEKIKNGKSIRIIGDYDIDGIQSSYILWEALTRCGAQVDIAIPHRITDGYGMNERLIRQAYEAGIDTILTCDNGISAESTILLGKELGMTIVVTDHHEVPYEDTEEGRRYKIPCADAVVNPKQKDCNYPHKGLCGAGVVYKLVHALFEKMGKDREEVYEFLPYVAFATVCDVMELTGENRILVKEGLKRLSDTKNKGLKALIRQNKLTPEKVKAYHFGFVLGPCLNASGRLDTAERALRLMQSTEEEEAIELAKDLVDLNTQRKEMTEKGVKEAELLAEKAIEKGHKVLVLYLPDCHESLAGIIAGRIREKYNRPVFVLTKGEEGVKGSGRSTEEYSMYEELCKIKDIFVNFGGHPMAAGVSLAEKDVECMRTRLNELTTLTEEDFIFKVRFDARMPLNYITKELIEQLDILEPFGKGNEKPIFAEKEIRIMSLRIQGKNNDTCKMLLMNKAGTKMNGIFYKKAEEFVGFLRDKFGSDVIDLLLAGRTTDKEITVSFVYYPEMNSFNGQETLQIIIKKYC